MGTESQQSRGKEIAVMRRDLQDLQDADWQHSVVHTSARGRILVMDSMGCMGKVAADLGVRRGMTVPEAAAAMLRLSPQRDRN